MPSRLAGRLSFLRPLAAPLDLLFPAECAFCREPLAENPAGSLCPSCRAAMAGDLRPRCGRCGSVVSPYASGVTCPACPTRRASFTAAVCLGSYENRLRDAVLRMKQPGETPLAFALADVLAERCGERFADWNASLVVPVPMHWRRRIVRGTNSAQLLAERLAAATGARYARLLSRRKHAPPQASLPPSIRRENMRSAFRARRPRRLAGKRILLVDDVMTTGATCHEAARTLLAAGAGEVLVAVVARSTLPQ